MADVSKIKLPDNSIVNIKDARIPGVDLTPTSGSDNLVTSGGIYEAIIDTEQVTSAALNDLNDRLIDVEDGDWVTTEEYSHVEQVVRDTYTKLEIDTMFSEYDPGFVETDPVFSQSAASNITSSDITNWNNKTSNTGTITGITMNGSSKGTSGVVNLGTVVTSESDPIFTASVAHDITASDITNWNNKTSNIGTVTAIKINNVTKSPVSGIVDLGTISASGTETDPVFTASAAYGISSSDITNWNSKTSNTGTITGITMNGVSKGTSGVVDLGTVIISETSLSKGSGTGSGNAVTDITVSGHQISLTKDKTFLESETDPVFSASAAAGITSSDINNWNSKTSNTGTVTGVKVNGSTISPVSGIVDIGTIPTLEALTTSEIDTIWTTAMA